MTKKEYAMLEKHIIDQFQPGNTFTESEIEYEVIDYSDIGKPRPATGGGECKTDVYVKAHSESGEREITLSVKRKSSNEFQANKLKPETAEAYFGNDWETIVKTAALSIKDKFLTSELINTGGNGRTEPSSFILGWKLEVANKKRKLCVKIPLDNNKIRDFVYKGVNQPESKINAAVNGRIIPGSGIAHYLIKTEEESINSAQDVIDQMQDIDECEIGETYLIFTANNYRLLSGKTDGNRNLAVAIKWECLDGKLVPEFIFNEPLGNTGGKDMKPYLVEALSELGFHEGDSLPNNFVTQYLSTEYKTRI